MPTYAYACTQCDHRFDIHQSFSDAALTECPECTGRLRKVFGSVGVVFKGSGFYRTDSRESGKRGAGSGTSNGKTRSDATASGAESSSGSSTAKESTSSSSSASSGTSSSTSSTSSTAAPATTAASS